MFTVGVHYSRAQIYALLDLPERKRGGDWATGYHRHHKDLYVFCNVGVAGRSGHDYPNRWEGDRLVWHGKSESTFEQPTIRAVLSGELRPLIFYRKDDRAPFTFAGVGKPIPDLATRAPVRIDWVFAGDDMSSPSQAGVDEYSPGTVHVEGQRTQVLVNRYERDRDARDACVQIHGAVCAVCGFEFSAKYGDMGRGYIHVHHRVPVSELGGAYVVNPDTDLVPVCPNCHAMLHRRVPPYSVDELKAAMAVHAASS